MRDDNRLHGIITVLVARQIALYGDQVQLAIIWEASPLYDWAAPVRNGWKDVPGCVRRISVPLHPKSSIPDTE